MDSQVFIHFPHKHGEGGSKERAQDGVGCQDRGGENRVRVDEIVEDAQEHQDHAETKGHTRENADNPVNRAGIRPGKPEQAHGQGNGPDKRAGQTGFGRCVAAALALRLDVPPVQGESKGYGSKHSHHDAQKSQPPDALVPTAMLLVHNGERTKEHVQRAVHNGHVHREKKDNGLSEQQYPRPRERRLERLGKRDAAPIMVHLADVVLARHARQPGRSPAQDDGGIRLGNEDDAQNPHEPRKGGQQAHDPAPAGVHAQETAGNGAEDRAEKGGGGEDGRGQAALRRLKHVGNGAPGVGQGRRAKGAREEAQDAQRPDVLGAGAARVKGREAGVRAGKEDLPPEELAQGRPEQRPDGEAEHEQRDAERGYFLAGVELDDDLLHAPRVRGGDEGHGERGDGHGDGDEPFFGVAEAHGVSGVVWRPLHQVGVLLGARSWVFVVKDMMSDACLVYNKPPVGNLVLKGRFLAIAVVVVGRSCCHGGNAVRSESCMSLVGLFANAKPGCPHVISTLSRHGESDATQWREMGWGKVAGYEWALCKRGSVFHVCHRAGFRG